MAASSQVISGAAEVGGIVAALFALILVFVLVVLFCNVFLAHPPSSTTPNPNAQTHVEAPRETGRSCQGATSNSEDFLPRYEPPPPGYCSRENIGVVDREGYVSVHAGEADLGEIRLVTLGDAHETLDPSREFVEESV